MNNKSTHLYSFAIAMAIVIAIVTTADVINHEPMLALPDPRGAEVPTENAQMRLAAADVMKDAVGYIVSLTVALAAAAAFLVKDGFGTGAFCKASNIIFAALIASCIIKSLLFAYDAYEMIAIQLSEGYFYLSRVQQVVTSQAQALLIALGLTVFLISARVR